MSEAALGSPVAESPCFCEPLSLAAPFTSAYQPFAPSPVRRTEGWGQGGALARSSLVSCVLKKTGTFHGVTPLPCRKHEGFHVSRL